MRHFITVLLSAAVFGVLKAEEPKELPSLRESYLKARQQALSPIEKKYRDALDAMKLRYTKQGDLEAAISIDNELKQIAAPSGVLPGPKSKAPEIEVAGQNLVNNGNFEASTPLLGWKLGANSKPESKNEEGNNFTRVSATSAQGEQVPLFQVITFPEGTESVRVSAKIRCSVTEKGARPFCLYAVFKKADGANNGNGSLVDFTRSVEWKQVKGEKIVVPASSTRCELKLVHHCSGVLDIDDIHIEAK